MTPNKDNLPTLIGKLYSVVRELEQMYPGRRFTPDGHLVGSIGEVIVARDYGLTLFPSSTEGHDAKKANLLVQIKITQGSRVALYGNPQHLIVMKLEKDGSAHEVYNGPGRLAWEKAGKKQKNGQRPISLSRLKLLMEMIPNEQRLPRAS